MKELGKQPSLPILFTLLFLMFFSVGSIASSEKSSNESHEKHLCLTKGVNLNSQQCIDLIKQSKLDTVKLSPQITSKDIEKDLGIHLIEFYPFVTGSAGGHVD